MEKRNEKMRETKRRADRGAKVATETFPVRLQRLRKEKGYTQAELAEAVGLTRRMVAYYERETVNPPASVLVKLAEVFGITVDELLARKPEKPGTGTSLPNPRLWRKLRQVEAFPEGDRRLVLDLIGRLHEQRRQQKQDE